MNICFTIQLFIIMKLIVCLIIIVNFIFIYFLWFSSFCLRLLHISDFRVPWISCIFQIRFRFAIFSFIPGSGYLVGLSCGWVSTWLARDLWLDTTRHVMLCHVPVLTLNKLCFYSFCDWLTTSLFNPNYKFFIFLIKIFLKQLLYYNFYKSKKLSGLFWRVF